MSQPVELPDIGRSELAVLVVREGSQERSWAFEPQSMRSTLPQFLSADEAQLFLFGYEQPSAWLGLRPGALALLPPRCEDCRPLPAAAQMLSTTSKRGSVAPWRSLEEMPAPQLRIPKESCAIFENTRVTQTLLPAQSEIAWRMSGAVLQDGLPLISVDRSGFFVLRGAQIQRHLNTTSPSLASTSDGQKGWFISSNGSFGVWSEGRWTSLPSLDVDRPFALSLQHTAQGIYAKPSNGPISVFDGTAWRAVADVQCDDNRACAPTRGEIHHGVMLTEEGSTGDRPGRMIAVHPPWGGLLEYQPSEGTSYIERGLPWSIADEYPNSVRWVEYLGLVVGTNLGRLYVRKAGAWSALEAPLYDNSNPRDVVEITPFFGGFVYADSFSRGHMAIYTQTHGWCSEFLGVAGSEPQEILASERELWVLERERAGFQETHHVITHIQID